MACCAPHMHHMQHPGSSSGATSAYVTASLTPVCCTNSQLSSSVHEGADGNPYCEEHYLTQFAPKCASCDAPLNGPSLKALGKEWHPDCFVCTHCHKPFPDDAPCLAHENKPYCEVGCMCGHARDTFLNTVPCRRCCCPGGLRGVVWQQVHEV